jgi:hypothetical protein
MDVVDDAHGRKRKRSPSPTRSPSPPKKVGRIESFINFFSPQVKTGEEFSDFFLAYILLAW